MCNLQVPRTRATRSAICPGRRVSSIGPTESWSATCPTSLRSPTQPSPRTIPIRSVPSLPSVTAHSARLSVAASRSVPTRRPITWPWHLTFRMSRTTHGRYRSPPHLTPLVVSRDEHAPITVLASLCAMIAKTKHHLVRAHLRARRLQLEAIVVKLNRSSEACGGRCHLCPRRRLEPARPSRRFCSGARFPLLRGRHKF